VHNQVRLPEPARRLTRRARMARLPAAKAFSRVLQASLAAVALLAGFVARTTTADEPVRRPLEPRFTEVVQPFLKSYCVECHGAEKPKAKLDLSGYTSAAAVAANQRVWDHVLERLEAEEMPPEKAPRHPRPHERRAVLDWLRDFREQEARHNA